MSGPGPGRPPLGRPGRPRSEGLFSPDSVVRRVDRELVVLLGGGRALLMQVAHPSVARGVIEHSDYRAAPLARLVRTLAATYTVVFGTIEQANQVGAAVQAVHRRTTGPGYRATDPDLLLWVHATLVDTALGLHDRFLRPLSPVDAERYYQESTRVGEVFGLSRADQPEDLTAFRRYVAAMVDRLAGGLTEESRRLGRQLLRPRLPLLTAPAMAAVRELTAGLLPQPLRCAYGLPWDPARQAAVGAASLGLRVALPLVPPVLRRFPTAVIRAAPPRAAPRLTTPRAAPQPGGEMLLSTFSVSSVPSS
jgi:uncharacterized protein (DUF2236 family)